MYKSTQFAYQGPLQKDVPPTFSSVEEERAHFEASGAKCLPNDDARIDALRAYVPTRHIHQEFQTRQEFAKTADPNLLPPGYRMNIDMGPAGLSDTNFPDIPCSINPRFLACDGGQGSFSYLSKDHPDISNLTRLDSDEQPIGSTRSRVAICMKGAAEIEMLEGEAKGSKHLVQKGDIFFLSNDKRRVLMQEPDFVAMNLAMEKEPKYQGAPVIHSLKPKFTDDSEMFVDHEKTSAALREKFGEPTMTMDRAEVFTWSPFEGMSVSILNVHEGWTWYGCVREKMRQANPAYDGNCCNKKHTGALIHGHFTATFNRMEEKRGGQEIKCNPSEVDHCAEFNPDECGGNAHINMKSRGEPVAYCFQAGHQAHAHEPCLMVEVGETPWNIRALAERG